MNIISFPIKPACKAEPCIRNDVERHGRQRAEEMLSASVREREILQQWRDIRNEGTKLMIELLIATIFTLEQGTTKTTL